MPSKTWSISRPTQRAARNPVELGNPDIMNQSEEHSQNVHARISERAYALYEEHGREDGHALEDWLKAEQQVRNHSL